MCVRTTFQKPFAVYVREYGRLFSTLLVIREKVMIFVVHDFTIRSDIILQMI